LKKIIALTGSPDGRLPDQQVGLLMSVIRRLSEVIQVRYLCRVVYYELQPGVHDDIISDIDDIYSRTAGRTASISSLVVWRLARMNGFM
jgi:hypothetical protein